jgi:RNA polymerase sigma-70 factor (ECF subfamily)
MELAMTWSDPQFDAVVPRTMACGMNEADENDWDAILRRARAGEESAQRELVERLWPRVAGQAAKWCPRNSEVEDLAQEVFLRVFSRLWQFRGGSFPAWVEVITRRVCYDALRKQKVRPEWRFADLGDFRPEEVPDGAEPSGGRSEARRVVMELLARMSPEQAWLIREVEFKDRSIGVVSREMGWTEVAGRLRLLRARRRLRQLYLKWDENRNG